MTQEKLCKFSCMNSHIRMLCRATPCQEACGHVTHCVSTRLTRSDPSCIELTQEGQYIFKFDKICLNILTRCYMCHFFRVLGQRTIRWQCAGIRLHTLCDDIHLIRCHATTRKLGAYHLHTLLALAINTHLQTKWREPLLRHSTGKKGIHPRFKLIYIGCMCKIKLCCHQPTPALSKAFIAHGSAI